MSYAQELAEKFGLDTRTVMTSSWYSALFGTPLQGGRGAVSDLRTSANSRRLATSIGGVLTGRGADLIIVDDPLKASDAMSEVVRNGTNEWFGSTLLSRLNNKQSGSIVVVMQRLHENDLAGHLMEQEGWRVVRLPAIAEEDETFEIKLATKTWIHTRHAGDVLDPVREPLSVLEEMKTAMGSAVFAAQYQQRPTVAGGELVKGAWFQRRKTADIPQKFDTIVQSWDTASKQSELASYSVCTTWGVYQGKIYLLDVYRGRIEYPELKRQVVALRARWSPTKILIEDRSSGTQLIQELRLERIYEVEGVKPTADKVMRMHAQTAVLEGGNVYVPDDAAWLPDFLHEVTTFPRGKHDDQVDSMSQTLEYLKSRLNEPGIITWYREQAEEHQRCLQLSR